MAVSSRSSLRGAASKACPARTSRPLAGLPLIAHSIRAAALTPGHAVRRVH